MSVLIKGGRIVTASDDYVGDIYAENGTVTTIGQSLDVEADKVIDAAGKYVIPGAIDPHTHIEMFFGGTTTCDDFTSGTVVRRVRRHDLARRLLHAGAGHAVPAGARELLREDRALQAGDRRRLPHRRHGPGGRRRARGARQAAGRGDHLLQALHGLQGRRHGRRRDALQDHAGRERDRRAGDGPRRERRRDRRDRQGGGRRGEERSDLARPHPADGDGGRGDEPGRSSWRGSRAPPCTSSTSPASRRSSRSSSPARRAGTSGARPARSICSSTTRRSRSRTGRARSTSTRPRRGRRQSRSTSGRRSRTTSSRSSPPTTARSTGPTRRASTAATSRSSPTAGRGSRTGCTCSTSSGSAPGASR